MAVATIMLILVALSSSSSASTKSATPGSCYKSIIGLGDSLVDTGNQIHLDPSNKLSLATRLPYGETFFHRPTGRYSNGRLIIDFIAEGLGLPLVQPYFGGEHAALGSRSFSKGVNFAVAGSTVLDSRFFEERGIHLMTNVSLGTQLNWLNQFLTTIPEDRKFLQNSLILVGKTGFSEYSYSLIIERKGIQVIQSIASAAVNYMGSTIIEELIKLGAETILISGDLPIGCFPSCLTEFKESSTEKDSKTGCLNWLNKFPLYYNELLQRELSRIRELYPNVTIIYADFYNGAMQFFISPDQFGFSKESILNACCGSGEPYNYNASTLCGIPPATSCEDPSSFVGWDGWHLTEAAYKWMAQHLLQLLYTTAPRVGTKCPSMLSSPPTQVYEN